MARSSVYHISCVIYRFPNKDVLLYVYRPNDYLLYVNYLGVFYTKFSRGWCGGLHGLLLPVLGLTE